jgi:hypothetical protein
MRDSAAFKMMDGFADGAAEGIAEAYRLGSLVKDRVTAWENVLVNRKGGVLWTLIVIVFTLRIFGRKRMMGMVEREHDRILRARVAQARAAIAAAERTAPSLISRPGIIDPKKVVL